MQPIVFETSVISETSEGRVLIALFDRFRAAKHEPACMAILECERATAGAMAKQLGSIGSIRER